MHCGDLNGKKKKKEVIYVYVYTYICIYIFFIYVYIKIPLFWISFPFRSPQCIKQSSLCYTVCSHQLSILYIVSIVYICQSQSPNSSQPYLPPWYPYICSLRLCLYFCFVNKIVCTNFFRFHICALIYDTCFSLSDLSHSV